VNEEEDLLSSMSEFLTQSSKLLISLDENEVVRYREVILVLKDLILKYEAKLENDDGNGSPSEDLLQRKRELIEMIKERDVVIKKMIDKMRLLLLAINAL